MMKITEMFPSVMPDELQVEIDKQTHLYEGVCSWLENVKQSLLRGEDDAQVFRAPKTPAFRRKHVQRIKPIPEEVGDDADNSFDISSSSAQSSVSSCKSSLSTTKSRRTAAVKANLQIKTTLHTNLNSKLRQPSSEGEVCLQNKDQALLGTFTQNGKPPSKRMYLDRDSTFSCTFLVKTNVQSRDSDNILLSEISSVAREAGKMLDTASVSSQSVSGSVYIAPAGCRSSVASTEVECGHDPSTRSKRTRNKRACSKALKGGQMKDETVPEETVDRPNSLVVELKSNLLADCIVENSMCDGIMVKRLRKDTVSVMPSSLSFSINDHKLKLKPVVSLSHVNLSNLFNDGTVVGTSKNVQSDALNKASDLNEETKTNNFGSVKPLIVQNAVVSSEGVGMTEQSGLVAPLDDVIKHSSAAMTHIDDIAHGDTLCTKECVHVSGQAVATSKCGSSANNTSERVCTSRQAVAMSIHASPIDGASSSQVEKKNGQKSDQCASSCKTADNVKDSKFETRTEVLNENSGSLAKNIASQDSASVQKKQLYCNSIQISDQNDDQLIFEDTTFTVENVNEKQQSRNEAKTRCEQKTQRNSVGTPKNTTFTSPAHSLLDSTLKNASGKKLSPGTVLCDISNTMNTSASVKEHVVKDFKKTPQNFDSSYICSTPLYSSSSYSSSGLNWSCKVLLNDKLGSSHSNKQERPCKAPTSRSPVIFSPYSKVSVKSRVAKFENLNTLVEVTDENTDPVVPLPSVRVTRTKTRAMAAAAAAAEAASKDKVSDTSLFETTLKNVSATQSAARKSVKKALRISAAKSKKRCFTPNTSHDENKLVNTLLSSMKKYKNIVLGLDTFVPQANKGLNAAEMDRRKEEGQRRQKERAEEVCRKREIMLNAKAQEKKRQNEAKLQKVAEKREAQQREEQERRRRQERERDEKLQRLMQMRDEKQREEMLMKRMQLQQKLQEVEERRRQEEASRLLRLREQEEQEVRRKEELEKERAAEKEAAAREQALLQKLKSNATFTSQPDSTKPNMQEAAALNQTYKVEEVMSYKISDIGDNSDDELTIKHAVPKWAKRYQKAATCSAEFMAYLYISKELVYKQFGGSEDPDLTRLLGLTAQQITQYRRKSSMFPPRKC